MPTLNLTIRLASPGDIPAITEIYNEAILTTTATFDTEPKTIADRTRWLESHGRGHPVFVAEFEGQVVGWSALTPWSDRKAYDGNCRNFVLRQIRLPRPRYRTRARSDAILGEARRLSYHTLLARVAEGSAESLHLNEASGFRHVGTLKEVGRKFGRLLDVHLLQLMLNSDADSKAAPPKT